MIIITVARKPIEGTVSSNVLKHGCGSLNIEGCRIAIDPDDNIYAKNPHTVGTIGVKGIYGEGKPTLYQLSNGRWPANVILSDAPEVLAGFPQSIVSGAARNGRPAMAGNKGMFFSKSASGNGTLHNDSGSAARFFKQVKE